MTRDVSSSIYGRKYPSSSQTQQPQYHHQVQYQQEQQQSDGGTFYSNNSSGSPSIKHSSSVVGLSGNGSVSSGQSQWSLNSETNNNNNNNNNNYTVQHYNNTAKSQNQGLHEPPAPCTYPYITTTSNHYSVQMMNHYGSSSGAFGAPQQQHPHIHHHPQSSPYANVLMTNGLISSPSSYNHPQLLHPSTNPSSGSGPQGNGNGNPGTRHRETIHSGHFMVSDFEPESEALDEEYEVGMPIPPNPGPGSKVDDEDDEEEEEDEGPVSLIIGSSARNTSGDPGGRAGAASGLLQNTSNPKCSIINNSGGSQSPGIGNNRSNRNEGSGGAGGSGTSNIGSSSSSRGQSVSVITPTRKKLRGGDKITVMSSETGVLVQRIPRSPAGQDGSESSKSYNNHQTISAQPPGLNAPISIDGSLTKLFQCMSLAYRQKLTSPKWNPFKGVRLRWKDKIRLNNVIWRCWHMQFILKQKALICQFASPLDVDQHNKPEAVVMEGKYWKRKLSTVAAEYKKWRLFYRNRIMGWTHHHPLPDLHPVSLDGFDWNRPGNFGGGSIGSFIFDDDLLMDFSDTLFSSLTSSQPFPFPNPRELSRAGMVADFIQPGLVQLQPNLDDFMDTLEPLQDFVSSKLLPPVPEESAYTSSAPITINQQTSGGGTLEFSASDLPDIIQTRMQQNLLLKQQQQQQQAETADAVALGIENYVQQQQQSMYYTHSQLPAVDSPSNSVPPPPHSHILVPSGAGAVGLNLNSQAPLKSHLYHHHQLHHPHHQHSIYAGRPGSDGHFAVPKGKPRGRSRSGAHITTIRPTTSTSLGQLGHGPPPHSLQSGSSSGSGGGGSSSAAGTSGSNNPTTLLTHLLSNSSSSASASSSSSSNAHQHQLQLVLPSLVPWNPKNANETINPNLPLNFGNKAAGGSNSVISVTPSSSSLANSHSGQILGLSSGSRSPPIQSTTPSPPLGTSSSGCNNSGRPMSPSKQFNRPKNDTDREHRRVCHINAEQKRRCNIKNGFDMLHSLIPQLSQNPNAKVSKAAMLQKGSEYIRQLKAERSKLKEEIEAHRIEVENLNSAINNCQSLLPATGAPVSRQRTNKMKEMFDNWVRARTLDNWKFWIFSILIRPLLDSYNSAVSTASLDELCRTVLAWIDQHCSLVDLRPGVLNSLRSLCTTTDILTNPGNLSEEAYRAVNIRNPLTSNTNQANTGGCGADGSSGSEGR